MSSKSESAEKAYECFGSDDEDDSEGIAKGKDGENSVAEREISCGILSFHQHTEQSLLLSVKREIENLSCPVNMRAIAVLKAIDDYCLKRHWMMHMGPQKGCEILIDDALWQALTLYRKFNHPGLVRSKAPPPFIAVEMGTYCGYSAILMALSLKRSQELNPSQSFHLYTFEVNKEYAEIARQMIAMAALSHFVTVLLYNPDEDGEPVTNVLLRALVDDSVIEEPTEQDLDDLRLNNMPHVQFLFLDHAKDSYLKDLIQFEQKGLLKPLSVVCADNVVFANIVDYIEHVKMLERKGIVSTYQVPAMVEYATERDEKDYGLESLKDGVGKLTIQFSFCNHLISSSVITIDLNRDYYL